MSTFELVWDSRCGVAESPVWDEARRRLLFCDIGGELDDRQVHDLSDVDTGVMLDRGGGGAHCTADGVAHRRTGRETHPLVGCRRARHDALRRTAAGNAPGLRAQAG